MKLLEVENLTVEFALNNGTLRAVDGVSFAIEPGEAYGLVGESGSGKSVTALSLMGLLQPPACVRTDRLVFQGTDLSGNHENAWRAIRGRRIAMVFQDPMTSLNPSFSIGEQIAEAYRYHLGLPAPEAERRSVRVLERVRLPSPATMYRRYPHEFSGGMRQRVMIAMALACEPDLLIADEPTTALDVTTQAQILDLLQDLRRDMKMALLFISHNLEVVAQVCDRVAVMYAGKIMEVASAAALFAQPAHPYTERLVRSIPRRGQALETIPGAVCDLRYPPRGCRFHPRCFRAQAECSQQAPPLVEGRGAAGNEESGRLVACHFPLLSSAG